MLNTIARGTMGGEIQPGSVSMINLLDEDLLNQIAESAGARLWMGFVIFGSASAGILTIFIKGNKTDYRYPDTRIRSTMNLWMEHALVGSSLGNTLLHLEDRPRNESTATEDNSPAGPFLLTE